MGNTESINMEKGKSVFKLNTVDTFIDKQRKTPVRPLYGLTGVFFIHHTD